MIRCGMAELDITPALGSKIPGYFNVREVSGVKDPLYVKSLVVETDNGSAAIIVFDAISIPRKIVQAIRGRVSEEIGIDPAGIFVSATHTHTGGPVSTGFAGVEDDDYLRWIGEKAADSALIAYRKRKEAKIGFGRGHESDIAFNRRFFMKDGTVRTNPGIGNPLVGRPAGPIDPEVLVMRIDDTEGNPLGVLTNYACHTDTVGGTEVCADFPGELSRVVKRELGEQAVSLFMLGACGNINHHNVIGNKPKRADHYKWMGRILGAEVVKVRDKITVSDQTSVTALNGELNVGLRMPTEEILEASRRTLADSSANLQDTIYAKQMLRLVEENAPTEATVEVQALRIGELSVVGLPGEIFVEFGLDIKRQSSTPFTMIDTLCNGTIRAYICTREAHAQGGYEPRMSYGNRFAVETGERLVETAVRLLKEMD
ncbi:MAG: Neutral ceramidase [Paenibacillus sp.]|jgi:hypothetical protein|nr:Neutral ceramidase [Paenibacillus sp.]